VKLLSACQEKLWGQSHTVQHCLIEQKFVDGEKLLILETLNDRPAHYVIWVDSSFSSLKREEEIELIEEQIIEVIIEECGWDTMELETWPVYNGSCGYTWASVLKIGSSMIFVRDILGVF
jgi:hypothetical protein